MRAPSPRPLRPCPSPRPPRAAARRRTALGLAVAGWLLLLAPGAGRLLPLPAAAQGQGTPPPPLALEAPSYRQSAAWNEEPWRARAGHYGETADITSLPDGRLLILDRRLNALHVLDAAGEALDLWRQPDQAQDPASPWRWLRVDAGADGRLHVLSRAQLPATESEPAQVAWRVDHLDGSGRRVGDIELAPVAPQRYVDVAARADGRIYLVRTDGNVASRGDIAYGIEVYGATGDLLETLVPPQFTIPLTLDLDAEGRLYVVDQFPHTGQTPAPGKVDGVAVFGPDHAYQRTLPFSGASDVAAGPGGALYVSRNNEVYQLAPGEPRLLFSGPTIQKNPYALTSLGRPEMFSVDVRPDGRPVASLGHCSFQGLVDLPAAGSTAAPKVVGALDAPELRGPIHPWRIAASGDRTAVLQARYEPAPPDMAGSLGAPYLLQRYTADVQSVLLYQGDRLLGQTGACGVWNQPWGVRDIALDGEDLWTIDAEAIRLRQGMGPEPERVFALSLLDDPLATPQLGAVSAHGGRAALLDLASAKVILVDRELQPAGEPLPYSGPPPADLALHGDRLALAQGAGIAVHHLADRGAPPLRLAAPGPLIALAFGPGGRLVALSGDGWLADFGPLAGLDARAQGAVAGAEPLPPLAAWRLPDPRSQARDLAVDGRGRVLVTWVENQPFAGAEGGVDPAGSILVKAAGVWVFQPQGAAGETLVPPVSAGPGCRLGGRKQLAPSRIRAGETLTVTLTIEGHCPAARSALDLAVVLDLSKSMANDYGLDRARAALLDLLPRTAGADLRLALVGAGTNGGLIRPLGPLEAGIGQQLLDQSPAGERRLAPALALAAEALGPAMEASPRRRAVLLLTDGAAAPADALGPAVAELRAAGIAVQLWLHPGRFISTTELAQLTSDLGGEAVTAVEGPESAAALWDLLSASRPHAGALASVLTLEDWLSPGHTLVEGSVQPAANWDPSASRLSWELKDLKADRPTVLRYQLQPQGLGSRVPVDARPAQAAFTDGQGRSGSLTLPRPWLWLEGRGLVWLPWGE